MLHAHGASHNERAALEKRLSPPETRVDDLTAALAEVLVAVENRIARTHRTRAEQPLPHPPSRAAVQTCADLHASRLIGR